MGPTQGKCVIEKPILWDWTQITKFCSENASIHSLHSQTLKKRMHAGKGDEKNRLLSLCGSKVAPLKCFYEAVRCRVGTLAALSGFSRGTEWIKWTYIYEEGLITVAYRPCSGQLNNGCIPTESSQAGYLSWSSLYIGIPKRRFYQQRNGSATGQINLPLRLRANRSKAKAFSSLVLLYRPLPEGPVHT